MINSILQSKLVAYDSQTISPTDPYTPFYEKIIEHPISDYNKDIQDYKPFNELFSSAELNSLRIYDGINIDQTLFEKIISMRLHLLNEVKKPNNNYSFDKLVMMEILARRIGLELDRTGILAQISTEEKNAICDRFLRIRFEPKSDVNNRTTYADRKMIREFMSLSVTKQFGELVYQFDHLNMALHSNIGYMHMWVLTFWKYFPIEFCKGLKQFNALQQLYYLFALELEQCLYDFLDFYKEQELLPIAFCIYHFLANDKINGNKSSDYCLDEVWMKNIASEISRFREVSDSSYKELTANMHMSHNHYWHCGFLLSMALNGKIDSSYFTEIDFGSNMGLYSFELLAKCVNNKIIKINLLEDIAKSIFGSFKMKLQDSDKTYTPYFYHSSYMNYFIYAIESKYNGDLVQFKYEIEYLANCTQRQLFSWTPHLCIEPFSQLVYMVLAWRNMQFFKNHNLESLPETTKLLNSKKILKFFDFKTDGKKSFFEVLLKLLSSQENEIAFQLPDHSGKALDFTFKIPPQI